MIAVDLLVAVPLIGVAAVVLLGRGSETRPRAIALAFSLAFVAVFALLASEGVLTGTAVDGTRFARETFPFWTMRIDGLSAPLLALTALLGPVAVLASWRVHEKPLAHHALLLGLQAAVAGVFLAADVIALYVFWEAVLIPMYFLIGVWGHENRRHAAMKFFIYTFAGSALMLVGILTAVFQTGHTGLAEVLDSAFVLGQPTLVFWLIAAGMLVKIPAVPVHTWLADAHVEAPTAGSILLAGVLLKMGGYGLLRLALPIAPEAFDAARPILAVLGGVGIVYGALLALAQTDLKRLVALSSVSHMGFVLLGISAGTEQGFAAAMLVMVSHGLVAPLLFLLVGQLYDRTHTRDIERFGGMGATLPRWATLFTFAALASLGLPGLSGFPGELLAIVSGFGAWSYWITPAGVGLVLAAAYNLRAVRSTLHGKLAEEWAEVRDMSAGDLVPAGILAVGIVALGVWPLFVLDMLGDATAAIAAMLGGV